MNLDLEFTQMGLRMKNMVILDLSFPKSPFVEFKKNYDSRFIWMPCRHNLALEMAGGIASFGKVVVVYGLKKVELSSLDPSLNVKVLKLSSEGTFDGLEDKLREFGPANLLIPKPL